MENDEIAARPTTDPRFPSGPWTGFFLQYWLPGRQRTDVTMDFAGGSLTGRGRDRVGPYVVDGTYDSLTGRCEWRKKYLGKHSVSYRGVNDGRGIWGVWEIRLLWGLYQDRGGFHLWPAGSDVSEESDRTERAVVNAMRAEFGDRGPRLLPTVVAVIAAALLALLVWALMGLLRD
jgi:hypothetical protein